MKDRAVLVAGATSEIARALAARLAAEGASLYLAARDTDEAGRLAADLRVRHGARVVWGDFDAVDCASHAGLLEAAESACGGLDGVVVCFGEMGDAGAARQDFAEARRILDASYVGAVSLLTHAANRLETRGAGFIVGLSSVAGDRGRQSNYVYGSAKAGLNTFLQGLRNRLARSDVHVMTVKPGFVDTRMTFGMSGLFLVATPERVARDIVRGLLARRNTIYTPWFWRWILLVIRCIPEPIFKRLSL